MEAATDQITVTKYATREEALESIRRDMPREAIKPIDPAAEVEHTP